MKDIVLSSLKDDYVKTISEKEPKWLASIREKSFYYYQNLLDEVSPLYNKYSGVNVLKPELVRFSTDHKPNEPFAELKHRVDEIKSGVGALQVGNSLHSVYLPSDLKSVGLIIESINDALKNHEELIKNLFTNNINPTEDKFLALECSVFNSGIFVYVPKGLELSSPITIINALADDGASSVARNIFFADANSKVSIIQELYSPNTNGNTQQAYFELLETYLASNTELEMITLQAMGNESVHFSNRKAFLERDARIKWYLGAFGTNLSRYKVDSVLRGAGASAEHIEIIFGNKNQTFDVTANTIHVGPNSKGRVLAKSVLKDTAKSVFKGMIKIGKNAKASESYLAGHAILLGKGAKSDSIPGLEIETNEVKATHSASVAQMDEEQMFYLMSRGYSKEGARKVIIDGFLEPLARRMSPRVRAWINYLIDSKWQGKPLVLKTDEVMREMIEVEEARVADTDIFERHYKYR